MRVLKDAANEFLTRSQAILTNDSVYAVRS